MYTPSIKVSGRLAIILISVVFTLFCVNNALATHSVGTDLSYTCLGNNTYRITVNFYRDCAGVPAPQDAYIDIRSPSGCAQDFDVTLPLQTSKELSTLCPTSSSTCNGGSEPGIEQYIYSDIVTFPQTGCPDWIISFRHCCRNWAITNLNSPGSYDLYVEAHMNNANGLCNNSPIFTVLPVPFICVNQLINYNHGAVDFDQDSLGYTSVNPLDNYGVPISYSNGSFSPNNPMNMSGPFVLDPKTGQMTFKPSQLQQAVISIKVTEYRDGVEIGSTMRDMQFIIVNCTNNLPTASGVNGTSDYSIDFCRGEFNCFNIFTNDPDVGQTVTLNWNNGISGASFFNNGAMHPKGTFCWTPGPQTSGSYSFLVTVIDDACPANGRNIYSYTVNVIGGPEITMASTPLKCYGDSNATATATVLVPAGNTFLWSTNPYQYTATATGLTGGTYYVTVTDTTVCGTTVGTVHVDEPPPINISATITESSCGASDGEITVTVTGGTDPYSYNWNPPQLGNDWIFGLQAGDYDLTVSDSAFCSAKSSFTVSQAGAGAAHVVQAQICQGDSIFLEGAYRDSSGSYYDIIPLPSGCDSIVNTMLTVLPALTTYIDTAICSGGQYLAGGTFQTQSGTYYDTISGAGCDSVIVTTLHVLDSVVVTIDTSICAGWTIYAGGAYQSTSGTYYDSLTTSSGCDSIVVTNLTIEHNFKAVQISVCENDSVFVGGAFQTDAGTYFDTLITVDGCDSIVITDLTLDTCTIPFQCDGKVYLSQYQNGTPPTSLYQLGLGATVQFNLQHLFNNIALNAIGYNRIDNLLYGADSRNSTIYRIFNDGNYQNLGVPPGLTTPGDYIAGDVDRNGVLVISGKSIDQIARIGVTGNQAVLLSTVQKLFSNGLSGVPQFADMAFHPITGELYAPEQITDQLARIDPITGIVTPLGTPSALFDLIGAVFFDAYGTLYGYGNGKLFKINVNTGNVIEIAQGPNNTGGDACSCPYSLDLTKEVIPKITCPGDTVTYVFTVANATGSSAFNITFKDVLDPNLKVTANPGNLMGGLISSGTGIGTNQLTITGMNLPMDTSSFSIKAVVSLSAPQGSELLNQAVLTGLPFVYGDTVVSDDPTTAPFDDSTALLIATQKDTTIYRNLCSGELFGGLPYFSDTTFIELYASSNGCDSLVLVQLNVDTAQHVYNFVSLCNGDSIYLSGAQQTQSGTYFDTLTTVNGCDSIVITMLDVLDVMSDTTDITICSGDSVLAGGDYQTTAGYYPDTLTAQYGCDSIITINLTVDSSTFSTVDTSICMGESYFAGGGWQTQSGTYLDTFSTVGGCDSIIFTNLTVKPVQTTAFAATICYGQPYNGVIYANDTTLIETYISSVGCDSTVITQLTIDNYFQTVNPVSICDGESYLAGGGLQTQTGTYYDSLTSASGCDSIVQTDLMVYPEKFTPLNPTICTGQVFNVGSSTYTSAGLYHDTLLSAHFCDSIVVTDLTVLSQVNRNLTPTICQGDMFIVGSSIYTTTGNYQDIFPSANGCDSIVTTQLTVLPNSYTLINVKVCYGGDYWVGGAWRTQSGVYWDTLVAANGCDSVITTNLVILPELKDTVLATVCVGQPYQGILYNHDTTLVKHLTTSLGCDSTVTTLLSVVSYFLTNLSASICKGDSLLLGGAYQTLPGTYTDTYTTAGGCDSLVQTTLSIDSFFTSVQVDICEGDSFYVGGAHQTMPGNYNDTLSSSAGCDSIITTRLNLIYPYAPGDTFDICYGDSVTLMADNGYDSYQWNPGGYTGQSLHVATGTYTLITTKNGCTTSSIFLARAYDPIDVYVVPDSAVLEPGETVRVDIVNEGTGQIDSYDWSPSEGLSCDHCDRSTISLAQNYLVIATDKFGCLDSVWVKIGFLDTLDPNAELEGIVYLPNAFSPNGDGQNDIFYVYGRGIDYIDFRVADRWGEIIFKSTTIDQGWDGTFRGKLMEPGVYVYYLDVEFLPGAEPEVLNYKKKGSITLLR